ncbi:uncharacterized protein PHALS_11106 [Plasmopara halstedii]|uniref:Uncharacterized protein n=1 Tax=Plasmopara halstedii TaxID=4781 RepID=A0A0N7L5A5_PLAHL|nr:uncharacterized protein PHALS_11106 [Plasmopara halstedii]CEG40931.1 hypothetical protein PHALS_11106 [Plasmopara halstedii]|eukprot:XP_024577300.1 hypothetical protein PHALS_11106 [Plasmopara halstedii]
MVLPPPWLLPGSAKRSDLSDQKRPRRLGNLVEVASQTPTSFRSLDIPATSPDIRFDPGDDVVQQDDLRVVDVTVLIEKSRWRVVTRDAFRALENEILRDRSSAERHAEVAYRCADALNDLKHVVRRLPHLEDYRALSERLLAVKQANVSLHATVERLAPLEMNVVALCAQNQPLDQLLVDGPWDPLRCQRFRVQLRRIPVRLEQAHVKHRSSEHPFWKVQRIR